MLRSVACVERQLMKRSFHICLRRQTNAAPVSIQHYNKMLWNAVQAGNLNDCRSLYDEMIKVRLQPSSESYSLLLSAGRTAGNLEFVFEFFKRMVEGLGDKPNIWIYNKVLSSCAINPDQSQSFPMMRKKLAEAVYDRLLADPDVEPNAVTMTVMLSLYIRARLWEDMARIKEVMKERKLQLDLAGTTTIMTELMAANQFEMIMEMYTESRKHSHKTNVSFYVLAMNAAFSLGLYEEVGAIFKIIGISFRQNPITLSLYLRSLIQKGFKVAILEDLLEDDRYHLNEEVWRSVLNEMCVCGDTEGAKKIFKLGYRRGYIVLFNKNFADPSMEVHRLPLLIAGTAVRFILSKRLEDKSDLPLEIIVGKNREVVSEVLSELSIRFEPRTFNEGRLFISSEAMREWSESQGENIDTSYNNNI